KPKLLWANLLLTILVVIMLVWGVISAGLIFMIAVSIALIMNYLTADEQSNSIKDNAASALTMVTIILAAGSFLGILSGTGMLASIAMHTVKIIPDFISPYIHLVIGF